MGVELEKIEQISNWIIDRIIWLEQAKIILRKLNKRIANGGRYV